MESRKASEQGMSINPLISITITILGFVLATASAALAQQAVMIAVEAQDTHAPITNATIELQSPLLPRSVRRPVTANSSYIFPLSPGEYRITVTAPGYYPRTVTIRLKPRQTQRLIVELTPAKPLKAEITIRPPSEQLDETQVSSETILDQHGLRALPMARRTHLPDVISALVPSAVMSHDNFVHLRGNELSLNTFINGVSFFDNPHQLFTPGMSPDVIQSMNVITGGFPAEFGNRFGGILDIVTKSGFDLNNHGSFSLGIGSHLRHNASAEYGGTAGDVGYYLLVSGFQSDRFLNPPEPNEFHDQGKGLRSFAQLDYKPDGRNAFRLLMMADGTNFQIPNTLEQAERGRDFFQKNRAQTGIFTWDHVVSADGLLRTSFYGRLAQAELFPTTDPLSIRARSLRADITLGAKSDYTQSMGRHHLLKLGLDTTLLRLREDFLFDPRQNDIELPALAFRGRHTGGQVSVYAQDQLRLFGHFTANVGLRYDQYSLVTSEAQVSPRLNLAYYIPRTASLIHFAYNRFFMPPPIENLLLSSFLGVDRRPVRPMKSHHFEVGLSQLLGRWLRVQINTYIRKDRDAFETTELADVRHFVPTNFDRGEAYGAELSVEVREIERLGLSGYFNYSAARALFFGPASGGFSDEVLEAGQRVLPAFDQVHTGRAGITWRHRRSGLWTTWTLEYGSGTPLEVGTNEETAPDALQWLSHEDGAHPAFERLPQHLIANVYMGIDLFRHERHRVSLQFSVENITNRVFAIAKESEFTPRQFSPPRFFSGSIKVHF